MPVKDVSRDEQPSNYTQLGRLERAKTAKNGPLTLEFANVLTAQDLLYGD